MWALSANKWSNKWHIAHVVLLSTKNWIESRNSKRKFLCVKHTTLSSSTGKTVLILEVHNKTITCCSIFTILELASFDFCASSPSAVHKTTNFVESRSSSSSFSRSEPEMESPTPVGLFPWRRLVNVSSHALPLSRWSSGERAGDTRGDREVPCDIV